MLKIFFKFCKQTISKFLAISDIVNIIMIFDHINPNLWFQTTFMSSWFYSELSNPLHFSVRIKPQFLIWSKGVKAALRLRFCRSQVPNWGIFWADAKSTPA